jgi:hypothetical protein
MGIKDLFSKHPEELTLHKYRVVEKLRERIGDEDKVVRKSLYDLFKLSIFPGCKQVLYVCLNYTSYMLKRCFIIILKNKVFKIFLSPF